MTRDEMVAEIRKGLSFRASSTNLNTRIVECLQRAQRSREKGKTLPKFLIQEDATLTGTANVAAISLPSGFIRIVEDENIWWDGDSDNDRRELERADYKQLKTIWTGTTLTTPVAYALRKATVHIFPTPTAAHTYTYSYYKAADELDDGSDENVWALNAPDLLIAEAGLIVATDLGDVEATTKFAAMQTTAAQDVFYEILLDELADYPLVMGGNN